MSKSKKGDASPALAQDAIPTTPVLDEDTEVVPSEGESSTPVIDDGVLDIPAVLDPEQVPAETPEALALREYNEEFGEDAPNDKEPSVPTFAEYVEAGYDASGYHRRFGRNPKPNTERAKQEQAQASLDAQPKRRGGHAGKAPYTVWEHGSLQCNGVLYAPGESVDLTADQAEAIGECVSLA